jgi:carbon monoxide dehydrogenase subunit G
VLIAYSDIISLNTTPEEVWMLLRDTTRLAALVPGVQSVELVENAESEAYTAVVSEKVGPFKVSLQLEIEMTEIVGRTRLKASVKGRDTTKLSRVTGLIDVAVAVEEGQTVTRLQVDVEVLGKLATLGATVIRRRMKDLFGQFSTRFQAEFEAAST